MTAKQTYLFMVLSWALAILIVNRETTQVTGRGLIGAYAANRGGYEGNQ
jgi:hypothetical protein